MLQGLKDTRDRFTWYQFDHIDGQTFIETILKDFERFQFRLSVSRGSHVLYSHFYLTTWFIIYHFIDHNLRIGQEWLF